MVVVVVNEWSLRTGKKNDERVYWLKRIKNFILSKWSFSTTITAEKFSLLVITNQTHACTHTHGDHFTCNNRVFFENDHFIRKFRNENRLFFPV